MEMQRVFVLGLVLVGSAVAQQPGAKTQPQSPSGAKSSSAPLPEAPPAKGAASSSFPNQKDKVSYALGMNIGSNLHQQSIDVDPTIVLQGLKDSMSGGATLLTEAEMRATLTQLQNDLRAKAEEKRKELGDTNKKEGDVFLAANKSKEGVVALPSGLQYKILQQGSGVKPTAGDTVVCNYKGTLINGTEFDSSYKRGQPAKFPVTGVIRGWTEALQLMPTGSKWQLFIPPDLAYADRGAGNTIGPNSTLIFEVELLSIEEKPKPAAAAPSPSPAPSSPAKKQ